MLRAEGDEVGNWRVIAPLDVRAQELPALGEAKGVDGGGGGEDGMHGEVGADLRDLVVQVAEEGGLGVGVGVSVEADVVDEGAGVDFLGEFADGAEAICFVAKMALGGCGVSGGKLYLSPSPCHITRGRGVSSAAAEAMDVSSRCGSIEAVTAWRVAAP